MKKRNILLTTLLAASLLAPLRASHAQSQAAAKRSPAEEFKGETVTLSGTVQYEGRTFIADQDGHLWQIVNPKKLHKLRGQHVTITAVEDAPRSELLVKSVG